MNFSILINRRRLLLFCIDFMTMMIASLVAFFISDVIFGFDLSMRILYGGVIVLILCCMAGLVCAKVYKNIWRYASVSDFLSCVVGMCGGTILYVAIVEISKMVQSSIIMVLTVLLSTVGIITSRMCYTFVYRYINLRRIKSDRKRTLIVGAGDAGNRIIVEMKTVESCPYEPVALVDDDASKLGCVLKGVPVAGRIKDIPTLVNNLNISTIVVALPSVEVESKKRILTVCSETVCEVKNLPYMHELVSETDLLGQARKINVEDLLGREVIKLDNEKSRNLIKGSVCMVTGGGGSIGSELCRQIASYQPLKLVIIEIYENNAYDIQQELAIKYGDDLDVEVHIASVRDYDKLEKVFAQTKPELVFHAAAHKHVPLMEYDPEEAVKNNVAGTYNCAELAKKYNARKFVLVSTDKAVNPTNVMGATKRCCEMIVQYFAQQKSNTEFVAVRFGNVLGSNGSVIPLFERQISEGGPITVTHPDIIRYFMTIPEAVSLILQAGTMARGGEIFVLDMGEPVKILSLAENLIRLHGKEPYVDIDIKFSGLRPGEKLFEELLMDEEGLKKTENEKIFIGKQIDIDATEFIREIKDICQTAETNDSNAVVDKLRKVVPTFNHVVLNK